MTTAKAKKEEEVESEKGAGTEPESAPTPASPKVPKKALEGLTEGRIVHVVSVNQHLQLVHRPAIIVNAWDRTGHINVIVFHDGHNDVASGVMEEWRTSVEYDKDGGVGTWHWPQDCN